MMQNSVLKETRGVCVCVREERGGRRKEEPSRRDRQEWKWPRLGER